MPVTDWRTAVPRLREAGVEQPELDARRLAEWSASEAAFDKAIRRRLDREPVSRIVGLRAFWKDEFVVTPEVLDPRPDTEAVVEAGLEAPFADVLDLGTGSGCILLSLLRERTEAEGLGTDASEAALAVAKGNAERLGLADRTKFERADWTAGLDAGFDLVVSNPPYISETERQTLQPEVARWDPEAALFAGVDGLRAYRSILVGIAAVLRPQGRLILEVGAGQAASVAGLCRAAGFEDIGYRQDLAGHDRCIVARRLG